MDQVKQHKPPPNPAKMSDSRAKWYVEAFNTDNSWELDALNPETLHNLARERIKSFIDWDKWNARLAYQADSRAELSLISKHHEKVAKFVAKIKPPKPRKRKEEHG